MSMLIKCTSTSEHTQNNCSQLFVESWEKGHDGGANKTQTLTWTNWRGAHTETLQTSVPEQCRRFLKTGACYTSCGRCYGRCWWSRRDREVRNAFLTFVSFGSARAMLALLISFPFLFLYSFFFYTRSLSPLIACCREAWTTQLSRWTVKAFRLGNNSWGHRVTN